MNGIAHTPPEDIEPVYRWYKKAQVDYVEHFMRIYISYNAWYREVTVASSDRESLAQLKKRVTIWKDYVDGRTLQSMKPYVEKLAELTQREPLGKTLYWDGFVKNSKDWVSIIEFWYQIRCLVVHGANVRLVYVWLAYETLNAFMSEIIDRMQGVLDDSEWSIEGQSHHIGASKQPQKIDQNKPNIRQMLHKKYITSPNIWDVDMKHV